MGQIPDYLPHLISYSKKLSGLTGFIDFDLLRQEYQNTKSNSEPICQQLASAPLIYMSKLGGIAIGCFSRWRRVGDIIANLDDGLRILAYNGNLKHRSNKLLKILGGNEFLIKDLNEIFSLILWDQNKNEITLVTDRYGNLPIYFQYENNRLIFASEVKTILLMSGHRATLNREVLEELLWFGCPLTEQTLFRGIKKIPPGTFLRFTSSGIKKEEYWSPKFSPLYSSNRTVLLDRAEQSFRTAIKRASATPIDTAMALSGGIDTRIMLAEIVNLGLAINGFTMGVINAADLTAAKRLNRFISGQHYQLIFNTEFLRDFEKFANELVWLSEGNIFLQDTHLIYSNLWCQQRFKVLIDGGWGEVSKRGPLKRISRSLKSDNDLSKALMNNWGNNQLLRLFLDSTELDRITDKIQQKLQALISQFKQDTIGDTIDILFLRAIWPNRISSQIALQNNYLEGQLPFLDYEFMDAILQLPCKWREQCLFHFYVVAKCAPELKRFGRVHCDMLVPWTENYYLKYMLPALNLAWRKLGFSGFDRPNFLYPIWWRRELKEQVKSALNSFAKRGFLNPKGFNEIFEKENINSSIYDIAASRLWTIELWCEHFLDNKEFSDLV
jgi:hypothetical protein